MEGYVGAPAHKDINGPDCPKCSHNLYVKPIMWGRVQRNDALQTIINERRILLGGCFVDDSNWYCGLCMEGFKSIEPVWNEILKGVYSEDPTPDNEPTRKVR